LKNIRLFINDRNLKQLIAFSDDSYLYNYIVNNYSELPEDNIFRNPTATKQLEDVFYFSKTGITEDDELVWNETSRDLKKNNVSYYAILIDQKNGTFLVYNNLKGEIPILKINKDTDLFEAINKIESFNKEIEYEEEMEL